MEKLRNKFLSVALDAVLHPVSTTVQKAVQKQQVAASKATDVKEKELTAQEWFEKGYKTIDPDEKIRCYTEAIRLKPDYAAAYNNRGIVRKNKGDLDGAIKDYTEAVRLKPDYAEAYNNRGIARKNKGSLDSAIKDYTEAIRLRSNYAEAYNNRGIVRHDKGDLDGAIQDYTRSIELKNPELHLPYSNRGIARKKKGDLDGAIKDYTQALRLNPNYAKAYWYRGNVWQSKEDYYSAAADYQKYFDVGGTDERVRQSLKDAKAKIRK